MNNIVYGNVHYPFHLVESEFGNQFKINAEKEKLINLRELVNEDLKRLNGKRAKFFSDKTIIEGTDLGSITRVVRGDKVLFYDEYGNLIDFYTR